VEHDVAAQVRDFILAFTGILYEAMPFIVLGALIAGILEELLPQRLVARMIPRRRGLAIAASALLGLVFPMCECGIIPVMRRLLRKGVPLSCCTAYLLAGPIINPVVLLSTWVAFSGHDVQTDGSGKPAYLIGSLGMVMLRAGVAFLVAVGTSMIVERLYRKYGSSLLAPLAVADASAGSRAEDSDGPRKSWLQRLSNISETALHDFVDITVFLILGALLAAFARQMFTNDDIADLSRDHPVMAIGVMMGLAAVLCLCSEADAFVAASFIALRPSAKLAFLVLGPMLDLKLYLMYTRVFRQKLIWNIIAAVVVQVFVYSLLFHFVWENYAPEIKSWWSSYGR
jgi:uncharacterized membrane protein YraQ (UPF0718 family)